MKIAILGTGSLARLYGAVFEADHPLMVGRQLGRYQLIERDDTQSWHVPRFQRWEDPAPGPWQVVLIAVKWPGMPLARQWLERWVQAETYVVTLLNGMGQEQALVPPLTMSQLSPAVTTDAAFRSDNPAQDIWRVSIKDHGTVRLTETSHANEQTLKQQAASLNLCWEWHQSDYMLRLRWTKLIANSVINPLSALSGQPNGTLLQLPLWRLAEPLCLEAENVAQSVGVSLNGTLKWVADLALSTASNRSSMLQDVLSHQPSEIESITGYIVRQANQAGIPVPTHQAILHLIHLL
ncbi:MAG: 2-dehydropantoate 2-reductase [Firmicutes bacterium]|jgi:2-dehydropantoate 2-reductase|nr:2-dehydropantoate 2-reductase [Bacillota bacterium]